MTRNCGIFLWCKHQGCDEAGIYCTTEGMTLMNRPFTNVADAQEHCPRVKPQGPVLFESIYI